jgi:sensor histidine kinase YesM
MSTIDVSFVFVLALFLAIVSSVMISFYLIKVTKKIKFLTAKLQSNSILINELKDANDLLQHQVDSLGQESKHQYTENSQVSKQLELRIKYLNDQNIEQQKQLLQWQENQGQDKFYNRAFKLAAKGATLEEIMNECELPRAEVEMLLSVHKQRV